MTKDSKELFKTFAISVLALIVLALWLIFQPKPPVSTPKKLVGKKLFAGFADPTVLKTLEITRLNSQSGKKETLRLSESDGSWKIGSYYDFPAENTTQMTRVVSPFLQLSVQGLFDELKEGSDAKKVLELFRSCQVVDPTGAAPEDKETTGILVKMTGSGGDLLVNAIIGAKVPESTHLRDVRYLRIPGEDMIYTVDFSTEATNDSGAEQLLPMSDRLSVDPLDWVNRDLLRISRWNIINWGIHRYEISKENEPIPGSYVSFNQTPEKALDSVWTLDQDLIAQNGKYQPNTNNKKPVNKKINDAADALGKLKFISVERLPENWANILREKKSLRELILKKEGSLPQGFKIVNFDLLRPGQSEPVIAGENGSFEIRMKEGVLLSIHFGKKSGEKIALLASARIDPALLTLSEEKSPANSSSSQKSASEKQPEKTANKDQSMQKAERELQIREAQEKAAAYNIRFADWIWFISTSDFDKINLTRENTF